MLSSLQKCRAGFKTRPSGDDMRYRRGTSAECGPAMALPSLLFGEIRKAKTMVRVLARAVQWGGLVPEMKRGRERR